MGKALELDTLDPSVGVHSWLRYSHLVLAFLIHGMGVIVAPSQVGCEHLTPILSKPQPEPGSQAEFGKCWVLTCFHYSLDSSLLVFYLLTVF
jgi:hypothetical protein